MTFALRYCVHALLLPVVSAPFVCVPTAAASVGRQRGELFERYPKAPKVLPAPGPISGLLVVNVVMKFPLGSATLNGAAVVATDSSTSTPIRAKALTKNVVLFYDVPAGVHALRFVTAETAHASLAVEVPSTLDFTVSVAPGVVSYLGTVTVRKKIGLGPPEVQIVYDAEQERDSWTVFLKKYPASPWSDLVRARLDSLRGTRPQ